MLSSLDFQSLLNIGAMLGGPLGGWMIDTLGRKLTLMISTILFGAGWLLIGLGTNDGMLYAGRFISGLGAGVASMDVPVSEHQFLSQFVPVNLEPSYSLAALLCISPNIGKK